MAAIQRATMVGYGVQEVAVGRLRVVVGGIGERRVLVQVLVHVQVLQRIVNESAQLVTPDAVVLEALQVNNENLRQFPDVNLFRRFSQLIAFGTLPFRLTAHFLRLQE